MKPPFDDFDTLAVHAGESADPESGALRLPLHMSTTFKLPPFGIKLFEALMLEGGRAPHAYTRWSNPTLRALEDRLVALETAPSTATGLPEGMAAGSEIAYPIIASSDDVTAGGNVASETSGFIDTVTVGRVPRSLATGSAGEASGDRQRRSPSAGTAAVVTASGMAAVSALALTLLGAGDHLVASDVCYAGSVELFGQHLPRLGIEVTLVDTSDVNGVQAALRQNTKLVFVETPANPILRLADIAALAQITHAAGAKLAVDSTWASPYLQQPLQLGADFVVHSLTKYLNGHGDALGGVVIGAQEAIHTIRKQMLVHLGGAMSPFNAWLILRGLATLPLRMRRHCETARLVACFLEAHPRVRRVIYPGLQSHPQHALACRQMRDFGGMVCFQLRDGLAGAIDLAESLRLFAYATSLGHAHSLAFYYPTDLYVDAAPYLSSAQKSNIRQWIGEGIVRLSLGLEQPQDLIADLEQALHRRTFKGLVGPALYGVMKRIGR